MDTRQEQLKKIYKLINELGMDDLSMTEIKQRFLVILDRNPLLSSWFLQLFPNRSTDSEVLDEIEEGMGYNYSAEDEDLTPIVIEDEEENPQTGIDKSTDEWDKESPKTQKQPTWTRDEDLIIFETVSGVDNCPEDLVLQKLIEILPNRSPKEIQERFQVIVHLIYNLSG